MDSILNSIKKLLGIAEGYTPFDQDIIMHINSTFMILNQMGVGPEAGFKITSDANTWNEYMTDEDNIQAVKTYVYMKARMMFDPPTSSIVAESFNKNISELEWRLNVMADKS